ncbi:MAG: hydrogenase nickel incorporation protein HypB [Candidatus Omnitrophica bacterium]|jgi:hydrogenase nickel incorporation protein HypB|nr:hydrogenase nickel incorporation protein HypB [Candidatus Omnitrophota bacterium]
MPVKVLQINENILAENDKISEEITRILKNYNIISFNLMGGPGAGKTKVLEQIISHVNKQFPCAVIEGDVAGSFDSERLKKFDIPIVQINTGGGCHLEAFMVKKGIEQIPLEKIKILFVENVGNLICPAEFKIGIEKNIVISSTTEGEDKPAKNPLMFKVSQLCILNKIDLLDPETFNDEKFTSYIKDINPSLEIIKFSAKTGQNIDKVITRLFNLYNNSF